MPECMILRIAPLHFMNEQFHMLRTLIPDGYEFD